VLANIRFTKRFDAEAEVIEVSAFSTGCGAACRSQLSVHWNEVNHRLTGAQLDQADVVSSPLYGTAQRIAVEAKHGVKINHSKYQVVNLANSNHGGVAGGG